MANVIKQEWKGLTNRQKTDYEFLLEQRDMWAIKVDGELAPITEQLPSWRSYDDAIFAIEQIEEKLQRAAEEAEAREEIRKLSKEIHSDEIKEEDQEEFDRHTEFWEGWLKTNDVYFVGHENKYYVYSNKTHQWTDMSPDALRNYHNISGRVKRLAFESVMKNIGRKKLRAEFTHCDVDDETLNMMRRDHWLKPTHGPIHELFEILMETLGAQNKEASDHIEQVLWWKYTHPEDFSIPCLVINGQGGVGKNTLADHVMPAIFGRSQVSVLDIDSMAGQFSGQLKGKTFVFLDEVVGDVATASKMKRRVGNKTIDVNNKGGKQEIIINTAMYMCGGNDRTGAVLLENSKADRRWSIINVKKSLIDVAMEHWNCGWDAALKRWDKVKKVYDNPEEVANFLGYLETKWGGMEHCPDGYHGEGYRELLEIQKGAVEVTCELVFLDDFDYILNEDLFEMYCHIVDTQFPSQKNRKKNTQTFPAAVRTWIDAQNAPYVYKKLNFRDMNGGRTSKNGFAHPNVSVAVPNRGKYIEDIEYGKIRLKGPKPTKYIELVSSDVSSVVE